MENFLSAGRRGQISHSASAVRGNFSGLCCLPSHTANEKCHLHYRMGQHKCTELKTTTLWPIVGKSSKGIYCSGKAWCVSIWTLYLRKHFTWMIEDICGRNNQEGLHLNENLRKQLVAIVIQAKDEEEACAVRSTMVHCETKTELSVRPLSMLGIYRAAAGDVLIKKPKQSWQMVYIAEGTGSNTTLLLLLLQKRMGLFAPMKKTATQDGW